MAPKGKRAAAAAKKSTPTQPLAPPPPSWPVFRPHLPVADLELETVARSAIVVARNFWPKSLCRNYVSFLKELPLTTTPGKPKRGEAVRVNDRFQINDFAFALRLWAETGLEELVNREEYLPLWGGEVVGLNPNIRVYRYSQGQFFDCHYDDYNLVTLPKSPDSSSGDKTPVSCKTTWTLLLYLTSAAEGCIGGETVFYPNDCQLESEAIAVSLETGMLLLHKHGEDCMLHEGREVTGGEKWVLRSDLCIKR
ncbi:putative L-ascorbic acid binding protein [Zalerion maritima]|uniref:L-ascorbic acid binding protein n=1 Tax=Zalerion maritima TaxID=339359 RepID=A0AAD5RRV3_9PEZI|nr:putative L-ascorbic acid binding protein [Zalerion maritima]